MKVLFAKKPQLLEYSEYCVCGDVQQRNNLSLPIVIRQQMYVTEIFTNEQQTIARVEAHALERDIVIVQVGMGDQCFDERPSLVK